MENCISATSVVNNHSNQEYEFIEDAGIITDDPFRYNWTTLQTSGNVSGIFFSKKDMWLDLVLDDNDPEIFLWIKHLNKINKPFIYAKGIVKQDVLEREKNKKIETFLKNKTYNVVKKIIHINKTVVYGLFSNMES